MSKLVLAVASAVMLATAAQAHDMGYSQNNNSYGHSTPALVTATAAVASPRSGLLDLNVGVGQTRTTSLLGLNVDIGGRGGLATVNANVGGNDHSNDFNGG